MPYPRYKQVDLNQTPYYHVISRCVRRTFLCGFDEETGESYEHRKEWVERRLLYLSSVFCIGVLAYAVMSNHTHIVLLVDQEKLDTLSDLELVKRWHRVSKGTTESQEYANTGMLPNVESEKERLQTFIIKLRKRFVNLSWFMKLLNEYIARKANKEDECTGHFWEGRFKSYALLDLSAVISCMIYVDLNPFRAGIVDTPEDSKYTSLRKRLLALKHNLQPPNLLHFTSRSAKTDTAAIPLPLNHYLQLVDESARISKNYNQQKISPDCCDILTRLGLQADQWQISINNLESLFPVAIGNIESMDKYKVSTGRIRLRGAQNALKLYRSLGLKTH